MASRPPTDAQLPADSSPASEQKADERTRRVRVASDEDIAKAVKRVTRDHSDLVKDLAK